MEFKEVHAQDSEHYSNIESKIKLKLCHLLEEPGEENFEASFEHLVTNILWKQKS